MNTHHLRYSTALILMLILSSLSYALSTTDADLLVYLSDTNASAWLDTKANSLPKFHFNKNGDASVSTSKLSPFGTDYVSTSGNEYSKFNNTNGLVRYMDGATTNKGLSYMWYMGAQQVREDKILFGAFENSAPSHGMRIYGRSNLGNTLFALGYESDGTLLYDFAEEGTNFVDNNNYCVVMIMNTSGYYMYVNKTLKETGAMTATTYLSMTDVSTFDIGGSSITGNYGIYSLSDFAIYNRSISVAEITTYCDSGITAGASHDAPTITSYYRYPADLTILNSVGGSYYVYNITNNDPLNTSTIMLWSKTNSSSSGIWQYVNGSAYRFDYTNKSYVNNASIWFNFSDDDNILSATYLLEHELFEDSVHTAQNIGGNTIAKIEINNYTKANYSFFEVMANISSGTNSLTLRYCNETYSAGSVTTSTNCFIIGNIPYNKAYNHSHGAYSQHHVIPVNINASGYIGSVYATTKSYFVLSTPATSTWNLWHINYNNGRGAYQTSINNGVAWTSQTTTADAHLHNLDGTEIHYFKAQACTTFDYCSNSSVTADSFGILSLPPTPPVVYLPNGTANIGSSLRVEYTAAIGQANKTISYYAIDLTTESGVFVAQISANNGVNLNISYNSAAYNGHYRVKVTAYDVEGLSAYGISSNFTIDNTLPQVVMISPLADNTSIYYNNSASIPLKATFSDNNELYNYWFNVSDCTTNKYTNNSLISGSSYSFNTSVAIKNWTIGTYCGNVRLCDAHTAGEINPALKVGKGYNNLNFTFPDTVIKISTTSPDAISAGYEKLIDRYSFEFTYSSKIAERTYILESDKPIVYLKNSKYKGHFIIDGRYWVDFEPYDVTVYESSGSWYIVTRNSAVSEKFLSIGELNCINNAFTFELREPPSDNVYSINILKWTNWFNFDAIDTGTTAGVLLIFFLLAVLIALITLSETLQIPFFAFLSAVYGIFFGMLVFTVISAILGVLMVILSAGYIIRSLLMAR